jgi:hypothetical protein
VEKPVSRAIEVAGDVATAASAMAGLILVFIGAISSSFDSYQKVEQKAVLARYQRRAWLAFSGFVLALLSTLSALIAKWRVWECAAETSFALLFAALIIVLAAAFFAVKEIV